MSLVAGDPGPGIGCLILFGSTSLLYAAKTFVVFKFVSFYMVVVVFFFSAGIPNIIGSSCGFPSKATKMGFP